MAAVTRIGPGGSSGDNNKISQAKYHLSILKNLQNTSARRVQAVNAIGKILFKIENPPEDILDALVDSYSIEREGIVKSSILQKAIQIYYPNPKAKKLFFDTLNQVKNTKSLFVTYNPSVLLTLAFSERDFNLKHEDFKELFDFLYEYEKSVEVDQDGVIALSISTLLFSIANTSPAHELNTVKQYLEASSWLNWLEEEEKIGDCYARGILNLLYPGKYKNIDNDLLMYGAGGIYSFDIGQGFLEFGEEESVPVEKLKEIYDELADADKPIDYLQNLLISGKRVLAIKSYSSDMLLLDRETPEEIISLVEFGDYKITHLGIPLHENNEDLLYQFLGGADVPLINKLICDYYFTDEKLEDFEDAKEMFKSVINAFLSVGGKILFYGGEPGLEGELLAENKANKIKSVLDKDSSNRVVLYNANYEMAKTDIDSVDSEPIVSFVNTLSQVVGENIVASVLSQDDDCWEMLELELLDLLEVLPQEFPDATLKDFGISLEGKKIGSLRFSLSSTQKFEEAFDGLIFRRNSNDDDDDDGDDSPVDYSPTESPEVLLV